MTMTTLDAEESFHCAAGSDGEETSSICCAIDSDLTSRSSLESNSEDERDAEVMKGGDDGRKQADFPLLEMSSLSDDTTSFLQLVQNDGPLFAAILEFQGGGGIDLPRNRIRQQRRRLENPSAAMATDLAQETHMQFTELITKSGNLDQRQFWSEMSQECCDEFLCHIFLPGEAGGCVF